MHTYPTGRGKTVNVCRGTGEGSEVGSDHGPQRAANEIRFTPIQVHRDPAARRQVHVSNPPPELTSNPIWAGFLKCGSLAEQP
jgi:hypothetical protein